MDLINPIDLHLLEGLHGLMQLDVGSTYKLIMNHDCSLQEL